MTAMIRVRQRAVFLPPTRSCRPLAKTGVQHEKTPSDFLFRTNLKIVSPQLNFGFNVWDNVADSSIVSGEYTTNPTYENNRNVFSENDTVTVSYLKFQYQYRQATFGLSRVETLLYLSHASNPWVVQTDIPTIQAWENDKITIDKPNKLVTINNAAPQEIYDFFQYWQSLPANADTLPGGLIYDTDDGVTFTSRADWNFVQSNIDTIYVAFSTALLTAEDVVPGSNGLSHYSKVFTSIAAMMIDTEYGPGGTELVGKHVEYQFTSEQTWTHNDSIHLSAWTLDANTTVKFTSVFGHKHTGVSGTGAIIYVDTSYKDITVFQYTYLVDIEVQFSGATSQDLRVYPFGVVDGIIQKKGSMHLAGGDVIITNNVLMANFYRNQYTGGKIYNNVIQGLVSINVTGGTLVDFKNNVFDASGISDTFSPGMTASHNAFVQTPPVAWQEVNSIYPIVLADEMVNPASFDFHLKNASQLIGAGADVSADTPFDADIDGNPWLDDQGAPYYNIGADMLGDILFASYINIQSTATGSAYAVEDKNHTPFASGILDPNPTMLGTPILANSLTDEIYLYHLEYGFKYKASTFVVTEGSTLMFASREANTNITQAVQATVDAYPGIVIDKVAKTVTFQSATTQAQAYDYLQSYQSKLANTELLPAGEIFSTVLGNTFNLLPDWTFVFDAIPSGAWNIDGGTVVFNFAGGAVSDFDYGSTLYFDSGADSSIFAFTDSSIVSIDTVVGYGGVGGIGFTPAGTTQVPTNLDLTNITINAPQPTVTITGHPVGATVVIHDEDSADLQNKGTSLQRFDNAAASVHYTGTVGNLVSISMYEPGYKIFERQYTIPSNDATFIIEPELETN